MRVRQTLRTFTAISVAVIVALAVGVSAASLNGVAAAKLGAWNVPGTTSAPTVLAWANFNGTTGTNLNGQALNGGGTWTADIGTWTIQGNAAAAASTALANLVTSAGTNSASVLSTMTFGATARAGVLALDNSANAVYALYSKTAGGTVQLYKYNGGATLLATVTGVGTPTSAVMKLDATTSTLKVSWNGTVVLSYTLSAAEITVFKTGTNLRYGIIADSDSLTRFDDFHVDG
jgi:hypothetical protein